jgi:3-hydroxyisobutyrate dehydrogenase-like beta-hydroxyacid dehydrogenase
MAADTKSHDVVVVGCGLMGAALARTLAKAGHSVAAWNRTPDKAEALAPDGVAPMRSIEDAVASSALVLACTSTYETTQEALAKAAGWDGAALVNVGTGTPDGARDMARWAADRDIAYLDGAILAFPEQIGTPDGLILFSGSNAVWSAHEALLMSLGGGTRHVSEEVAAANVLDAAMVGAFYTSTISAYVEAMTYARSQGVSAADVRDITLTILETLQHSTEEAAAAIESGNHETDQATLEVYAEALRSVVGTMEQAGLRVRILPATLASLEAAEAAGLGGLGIYAQTKVIAGAD